jgi:hypothetical protein
MIGRSPEMSASRLTKAGFTALQSLQTATLNIRNIDEIAAVIIRGKLLTQPDLDRIVSRHLRTSDR